ncbi:hypothetical protein DPMN_190189 [Dreissena polymorpha]|uniref:Uncharacterized protein n=1 Tax=Dreissena polymorpha TaxID=45954 RepID=A0A9D4DUX5_DREPO|nr:hypothetical protein DPMN_190189 [Dreissena polymorpha]
MRKWFLGHKPEYLKTSLRIHSAWSGAMLSAYDFIENMLLLTGLLRLVLGYAGCICSPEHKAAAISKSEAAVVSAMTNVYFAAQDTLASSLVPDLNRLCVLQGETQLNDLRVDSHTSYEHSSSMSEFQNCMADVLKSDHLQKIQTSCKYSIMSDETHLIAQMTPIDFQVVRIMKLHRYNDHDSQMTTIDFQVTRSKVKVTTYICNASKKYFRQLAVRLKAAAIKKTQINIATVKRKENADGIENPESAKTKNKKERAVSPVASDDGSASRSSCQISDEDEASSQEPKKKKAKTHTNLTMEQQEAMADAYNLTNSFITRSLIVTKTPRKKPSYTKSKQKSWV